MKLNEIIGINETKLEELDENGFIKDKGVLDAWLQSNHIFLKDYIYFEDLHGVKFTGSSYLEVKNLHGYQIFDQLPVYIIDIREVFGIDMPQLKTLKGRINQYISGSLVLKRCVGLTSFEGYPEHLKSISLPENTESLIGISNAIKSFVGSVGAGQSQLVFPMTHVRKGGLELLQIEGLRKIGDLDGMNFDVLPQFKQWKIISNYLGKPDQIFECQQELIEAGFEEYAQL